MGHHRSFFERTFGSRMSRTMEHGVAGCMVGFGEVALIPIDSLKVKMQTGQPLGFRKSATDSVMTKFFSSFRGCGWMAVRNGIGSFTLFGGAAMMKMHALGLESFEEATPAQNFFAATLASGLCVWISSPFDVVKTRVQRQGGGQGEAKIKAGREVAVNLLKHEGPRALWKGSVPKCALVAPKLIFTYTVAHSLYQCLEKYAKN